jgi:UDPglucose 6-dehydrogenase
MKNKVGLVGYGIVGKALGSVLSTKFELAIYDKYLTGHQDLNNVLTSCNELFVAVPTPMNHDGSIDLSYVTTALSSIKEGLKEVNKKNIIVVLRSTIVPGTTEKLQKKFQTLKLVFNPEFLTERTYIQDMKNTARVVLGGNKKDCEKVAQIYKKIFPKAKYIITNSKTAEMIKYSANITLAGQVIIANELFQICKKIGIDWSFVRDAIVLDSLIGKNNNVPGPDGDFGFGGKCLPKDLNALIHLSKQKGYNPEFLEQAWKTNLKLRKNYNWELIKGATSKNGFKSI